MDTMKIMLEVMIKINDDALLNWLCIFVCVFGHLFDQKYLAPKFITFQYTSSVDFFGNQEKHSKSEPNMLKILQIILSSVSQKVAHYPYFILILFPYYSLCFFISCIDIQRNMYLNIFYCRYCANVSDVYIYTYIYIYVCIYVYIFRKTGRQNVTLALYKAIFHFIPPGNSYTHTPPMYSGISRLSWLVCFSSASFADHVKLQLGQWDPWRALDGRYWSKIGWVLVRHFLGPPGMPGPIAVISWTHTYSKHS